ncbi:MAG TPA: DnaJ domain-containing protein [Mucilaginibacter sp.]
MKDFYAILGTDVNCTPNEIREAYRKLSKKFHPDLNGNDHYFESRFKEIREAYETLSDPAMRNHYDVALKKGKAFPPGNVPKKLAYRFKTKHIDVAFSITLIAMTLGFGYYVYKSIWVSKATNIKTAAVATPRLINPHKKRHKHKIKTIAPNEVAKITKVPATEKAAPVMLPVAINSVPATAVKTASVTAPLAAKPDNKPIKLPSDTINIRPAQPTAPVIMANYKPVNQIPVTANGLTNPTITYLSAIKGNATGVVYLRKTDDYNSDVVVSIPTNSKVVVLEKGKAFYKVLFDHKTGYVPNWTIQTK